MVGQGTAWQGKGSSEQWWRLLRMLRQGLVRQGEAGRGMAGLGSAGIYFTFNRRL